MSTPGHSSRRRSGDSRRPRGGNALRIDSYELIPEEVLPRIQALWMACQTVDATVMPFNSDSSLNNHMGLPSHYLAYDESSLIGYLQLFHPRLEEVEVTGVTHPDHRCRGVFSALLDRARREMSSWPVIERTILVVDGMSEAGGEYLRSRGATLEDTEYLMELTSPLQPPAMPSDFRIAQMGLEDVEPVAALSVEVFPERAEDALLAIRRTVESEGRIEFKATVGEVLVGFGGLSWEGGRASIFGLGVAPGERRRGYGSALLYSLAREAVDRLPRGTAITLEVSKSNSGALELYRRLGFEVRGSYDYYQLPGMAAS